MDDLLEFLLGFVVDGGHGRSGFPTGAPVGPDRPGGAAVFACDVCLFYPL